MRLLIMGAPGAGKGTQAALIKKSYNIAHISTGDMFRKAMAEETPVGLEAKKYIDQGNLVPDEVTVKLVRERLQEKDCMNGFLLDGFPRTVYQAKALDEMLNDLGIKLDAVLNIEVEDGLIINRITGRRTCPKCNKAYHVVANKPKVDGICDACGSKLIQRDDDKEETIKNRLNVYYQKTQPVLDYYDKKKLVKNVKGIGEISKIFEDVQKALGDLNDID